MNDDSGRFTHFDAQGEARMVDVSSKAMTARSATAEGRIGMAAATLAAIRAGTSRKGDVLGVARIAAIQAAKRTEMLIPLCHQIPLAGVDVAWAFLNDVTLCCTVTARTVAATGVEMEALTATSVALLTVYDMCKAVDRGMTIGTIRLLRKEGGRSGVWNRESV
ncbi:MAG: cyclic pyranopterin monophosphate synthase MoaC [Gammaproteobacteria bacterium]|nr:cyclic pyranopterin monophosphate synthase MoaC [Gammaproteobacteria bacterium]